MYNVVFRNIVECSTEGVLTWSTFQDKNHFDGWYVESMRSQYEVVEEGVTQDRAIELCSSPEAGLMLMASQFRKLNGILDNLLDLTDSSAPTGDM